MADLESNSTMGGLPIFGEENHGKGSGLEADRLPYEVDEPDEEAPNGTFRVVYTGGTAYLYARADDEWHRVAMTQVTGL